MSNNGLKTTVGAEAAAHAKPERKGGAQPAADKLLAELEGIGGLDIEKFRERQRTLQAQRDQVNRVLDACREKQREFAYAMRDPTWRATDGRQVVDLLERARQFVLAQDPNLDPRCEAATLLWDALTGATWSQWLEFAERAAKAGPLPHPDRKRRAEDPAAEITLLHVVEDEDAARCEGMAQQLLVRVAKRWYFPKSYNPEPFVQRFAGAYKDFYRRALRNRDAVRDRQREILSDPKLGVGREGAVKRMVPLLGYRKAITQEHKLEYPCFVRFQFPRPGRVPSPGQKLPWWDGVVVLQVLPAEGGHNRILLKDVIGDVATVLPMPGYTFELPIGEGEDGWQQFVHRERPKTRIQDALVRAIRYAFLDFAKAKAAYDKAKAAYDAAVALGTTEDIPTEPVQPTLDQYLGAAAFESYYPKRGKGKKRESQQERAPRAAAAPAPEASAASPGGNGVVTEPAAEAPPPSPTT